MGLLKWDKNKKKNEKPNSPEIQEQPEVKPEIGMSGSDLEIKRKLVRSDFLIMRSKNGTPLIRLNPDIQQQLGFTDEGMEKVLSDFLDRIFHVK